MKQATRKRPAAPGSSPKKRLKPLAGTAAEPIAIDLDDADNRASPIDVDAEDSGEAPVDPGPSQPSKVSGQRRKLPSSGPSTAEPLNINQPNFDVRATFTNVKPHIILKDPDLDLLYFKRMSKELFEYLLNELPWYRVTYKTRGIDIRTPRWTCVWGCDETGAPPSAYKIKPRRIPNVLQALLEHMQEETSAKYNFVLVNFYENGKDSISWHSDDESSRDFQMKHKEDKSAKVEKWSLESGDCVVMRGTTQSRWLHSIPKRAKAGGRMNLTFRRAMNVKGTNNYYRYNVFDGPVHRWLDGRMVEVP